MNPMSRKEIVTDFFHLIELGKPKDGLKYFEEDCVQHNPYVHGGIAALLDTMAAVQQEQGGESFSEPGSISLKHLVEQGDIIVAHAEILFSKSDPSKGGLRQAHVFRFGIANRVIEYWDITQMVPSNLPNAANAF